MNKIFYLGIWVLLCTLFLGVSAVGAQETEQTESTNVLVYGERGQDVTKLQQVLSQMGFYGAAIDGIFGGQTETAVKKAQNSLGLPVTGQADRQLVDGIRRLQGADPSRGIAGVRSAQVLRCEATAYSPYDYGVGSYTASGHPLRRGLVAVDPRVIPLGTRLYIEGYGYAIASDTGGAIRGNKVDLAVDSYEEAIQFGRRAVVVHILE